LLRLERDELFAILADYADLFGQQPKLLQQMLSALFRPSAETDGPPGTRVAPA